MRDCLFITLDGLTDIERCRFEIAFAVQKLENISKLMQKDILDPKAVYDWCDAAEISVNQARDAARRLMEKLDQLPANSAETAPIELPSASEIFDTYEKLKKQRTFPPLISAQSNGLTELGVAERKQFVARVAETMARRTQQSCPDNVLFALVVFDQRTGKTCFNSTMPKQTVTELLEMIKEGGR